MGSESQIPTNELAEVYDAFEQLHTLLQRILAADSVTQSDVETAPMERYAEAIAARNRGGGAEGTDSYGHQQYERNPFPMAAYRERYGDGTRVEEFNAIETAPLTADERSALHSAGLVGEDEAFQLPVAPTSDDRLPLLVSSEEAVDAGLRLLKEFPATPAALNSATITSTMDLRPISVVESGQRLPELVVRIEAVQPEPDDKRDAELIVGDVDGTTVAFDLWKTHGIDHAFTQGEWYWLHEARCKAWEKEGTIQRRLSSSKDLVIESLGDAVDEAAIQRLRDEYDVGPPSADDLKPPSDTDSPVEGGTASSTTASNQSASTTDGDSTSSEQVASLMDDLEFTDES